jgi:hypothetical protein
VGSRYCGSSRQSERRRFCLGTAFPIWRASNPNSSAHSASPSRVVVLPLLLRPVSRFTDGWHSSVVSAKHLNPTMRNVATLSGIQDSELTGLRPLTPRWSLDPRAPAALATLFVDHLRFVADPRGRARRKPG